MIRDTPSAAIRDVPAYVIGPHLRAPKRYAQLDPDDPARVIIRRGPRDDSGAIAVPTAQLRGLLRAYDALRDAQHLLARAEALSGDPPSGDPLAPSP